jgi:hypothetical protein
MIGTANAQTRRCQPPAGAPGSGAGPQVAVMGAVLDLAGVH